MSDRVLNKGHRATNKMSNRQKNNFNSKDKIDKAVGKANLGKKSFLL